MAKNTINLMSAQRDIAESDLRNLDRKYVSLRREHQKLINETVELENNNVKLSNAIEGMCKGCVLKYTDSCVQCNLHEVAVELIWPREY